MEQAASPRVRWACDSGGDPLAEDPHYKGVLASKKEENQHPFFLQDPLSSEEGALFGKCPSKESALFPIGYVQSEEEDI